MQARWNQDWLITAGQERQKWQQGQFTNLGNLDKNQIATSERHH